MKKILNLQSFLAVTALSALLLIFSSCAKADDDDYYYVDSGDYDGYSYDQADQTADDSEDAANSNSDEEASTYAGYGFDTSSGSAPPVGLTGAGEHPTVQLLRNPDNSNPYTPQQYRSVKPSYVPPLP